jgi:hypothetical protein
MAPYIKRDLEFEDVALHVENNHKTQCYVSFYSSCHKKEFFCFETWNNGKSLPKCNLKKEND